ncbi:hypothetical protein LTR94_031049, partial [Friedmanniomyces endolithicus]
EADRQKLLVKKAELTQGRLLFVTEAFRALRTDENFLTLLRAEDLKAMPGYLEELSALLPVRVLRTSTKSSNKYQQIAASIREVGLVEPPVVARDLANPDTYLLLDGHVRIEVLKDLGIEQVECLVSTDDEAFTYNKRISRLSSVQEHKMIRRAIERGVPEEKIAKALD